MSGLSTVQDASSTNNKLLVETLDSEFIIWLHTNSTANHNTLDISSLGILTILGHKL